MDFVYAIGIEVITAIQNIFLPYEDLFTIINTITDPNCIVKYIFPVLAVFDSVLASDILVASSVGKWFNAMLKWLFYEDRPFWWVRETNYYSEHKYARAKVYTNYQTCETGPGSPSGHVMSTTSLLTLITIWLLSERKKPLCRRKDRTYIYTICVVFFSSIMLTSASRMFVSAHFPHQCILGSLMGILTSHTIVNYFIVPFLDLDEIYKDKPKKVYLKYLRYQMMSNICLSLILVILAVLFYWALKASGMDPVYSIKLAFKWCPSSTFLHYNTTPFYSLAVSTGSMLGWSLCVTPSIKCYRYNTREKSHVIAVLSSIMFYQIFQQWQDAISKSDASYFYIMNYIVHMLRPFFFLRAVPLLSTCRNKWLASRQEERIKELKKKNN